MIENYEDDPVKLKNFIDFINSLSDVKSTENAQLFEAVQQVAGSNSLSPDLIKKLSTFLINAVNSNEKLSVDELTNLCLLEEVLLSTTILDSLPLDQKQIISFCIDNEDCYLGFKILERQFAVGEDERLKDLLERGLSSFDNSIRLISLRLIKKAGICSGEFIDILIAAESIRPTLETYQDRAKQLRKLQFGDHKRYISTEYDECIILRIIMAQYSVNFSILWKKNDEIFGSYAHGMKDFLFFQTFTKVYNETTQNRAIEPLLCQNRLLSLKEIGEVRGDRYLFRLNIVKALSLGITSSENNATSLITMFSDIYYKEFKAADENALITYNLTESVKKEKEISLNEALSTSHKHKTKDTIVAYCELFSKFTKLGVKDENSILSEIIDEILMAGDSKLVKNAIQVIKAYKYKYVNSYFEAFEELGEEKKFKNALLKFQLNFDEHATETFVHISHRQKLVTLILKLLNGKMCAAKSDGANAERTCIFNFLIALNTEEIKLFLELLFKPFMNYYSQFLVENSLDLEKFKIHVEGVTVNSIISPYVVRNVLEYLGLAIKNMSLKFTDDLLNYITDINLIALAAINKYYEAKDSVHVRFSNVIKEGRKLNTQLWGTLFSSFGERKLIEKNKFDYFWSEQVTTQTSLRLDTQSHLDYSLPINIVFPDHILKFFNQIAKSYNLTYMFQLKISGKKHKVLEKYPILKTADVTGVIVNSLQSIYTMASLKNEIVTSLCQLAALKEIETLPIYVDSKKYLSGNALVIKYAKNLSEYFVKYLLNNENRPLMKKNELDLLSIISEKLPRQLAKQFINLFVYYLQHNTFSDDYVNTKILKSITKLLKLADELPDVESYIWLLPIAVDLLKTMNIRKSFTLLCDTIHDMRSLDGEDKCKLQITALKYLNEASSGYIGIENFDKRIEGYKMIEEYCLAKNEFDIDIFKAILLTNDYFIYKNDDLSCNQSAEYSMTKLLTHLSTGDYSPKNKEVIMGVYEDLICKRVKALAEDVRNSYIKILSAYTHEFPIGHKFSDLHNLRCMKEDFNFYEEITSIQLNQKQMAFVNLVQWIEENGTQIKEELLHLIILPIAKPYMDEVHKEKTTLTDEAIKVFSAVMKFTDWKRFNIILTSLIGRLLKAVEKVQVRLLVKQLNAAMDAFTIDLSHVKEAEAMFDTTLERKKISFEEEDAIVVDTIELLEEVEQPMEVHDSDQKDINVTTPLEAVGIVQRFEQHLIPKLISIINCDNLNLKRTTHEGKKVFIEDTLIVRAPIVSPLVRILCKLPAYVMRKHRHGIISKLCSLLICHTTEIREKARKIVVEISLLLGPEHLPFIIDEIGKKLTKGFQAHVGIYTIHMILINQTNLKVGDLDRSCDLILRNCFMDQFGIIAEEKEIAQIKTKCPEAREKKSNAVFKILGQYTKLNCYQKFEEMAMDQLNQSPDSDTFKKVTQSCESIANGASRNTFIRPDEVINFGLALFERHLETSLKKQQTPADDEDDLKNLRPRDALLLEAEPKRLGKMAKTSQKSRNVVFVAFGLQLISGALMNKKIDVTVDANQKMLEKFILTLLKCMQLKSDKLQNHSLNCLLNLYNNYNVPLMQTKVSEFLNSLFIILKNVSGTTVGHGDLKQKLFACFKLFIGTKTAVSFSDQQIKVLFANIKIEMFSKDIHANAMNILKEVVKTKLAYIQIEEMMEFIVTQAVQSHVDQVRESTRDVVRIYVNHNKNVNFDKLIEFISDQFSYSVPSGRKSALEMFSIFVDTLDPIIWDKCAVTCFVRLALLFDDDDIEVQSYAKLTMTHLLDKASKNVENDVIESAKKFINTKKTSIFLCGMKIIVNICSSALERSISATDTSALTEIFKNKLMNASSIFDDKSFEIFMTEFYTFFEKKHYQLKTESLFEEVFVKTLFDVLSNVQNIKTVNATLKFVMAMFKLTNVGDNFDYEPLFKSIEFQLENQFCNLETVKYIAVPLIFVAKQSTNGEFKSRIINLLDVIGKRDLKTPTRSFIRRCLTLLVMEQLVIVKEINVYDDGEKKWNEELFDKLFHFIYRHDSIKKSGSMEILPGQSSLVKDFEMLINENMNKFSKVLGADFVTRLSVIKEKLEAKRLDRKKSKFEERIRDPERAAAKKIVDHKKKSKVQKVKRKRIQDLKEAGVYEPKKKKRNVVSFDDL
uniref:DRIM domain-containing protein n=1 Tax=Rhabditophanes sp. KR3021 TaxID=114890 RepID=A0AC35UIL9_9BILA